MDIIEEKHVSTPNEKKNKGAASNCIQLTPILWHIIGKSFLPNT